MYEFLDLVSQLPLKVDQETAKKAMTETLSLANEHNLSVYDAAYLELALRYRAPLDIDLKKAASKVNVDIFNS